MEDWKHLIELKKKVLLPHLDLVKSLLAKTKGGPIENKWQNILNCITLDKKKMTVEQINKLNTTLNGIKAREEMKINGNCNKAVSAAGSSESAKPSRDQRATETPAVISGKKDSKLPQRKLPEEPRKPVEPTVSSSTTVKNHVASNGSAVSNGASKKREASETSNSIGLRDKKRLRSRSKSPQKAVSPHSMWYNRPHEKKPLGKASTGRSRSRSRSRSRPNRKRPLSKSPRRRVPRDSAKLSRRARSPSVEILGSLSPMSSRNRRKSKSPKRSRSSSRGRQKIKSTVNVVESSRRSASRGRRKSKSPRRRRVDTSRERQRKIISRSPPHRSRPYTRDSSFSPDLPSPPPPPGSLEDLETEVQRIRCQLAAETSKSPSPAQEYWPRYKNEARARTESAYQEKPAFREKPSYEDDLYQRFYGKEVNYNDESYDSLPYDRYTRMTDLRQVLQEPPGLPRALENFMNPPKPKVSVYERLGPGRFVAPTATVTSNSLYTRERPTTSRYPNNERDLQFQDIPVVHQHFEETHWTRNDAGYQVKRTRKVAQSYEVAYEQPMSKPQEKYQRENAQLANKFAERSNIKMQSSNAITYSPKERRDSTHTVTSAPTRESSISLSSVESSPVRVSEDVIEKVKGFVEGNLVSSQKEKPDDLLETLQQALGLENFMRIKSLLAKDTEGSTVLKEQQKESQKEPPASSSPKKSEVTMKEQQKEQQKKPPSTSPKKPEVTIKKQQKEPPSTSPKKPEVTAKESLYEDIESDSSLTSVQTSLSESSSVSNKTRKKYTNNDKTVKRNAVQGKPLEKWRIPMKKDLLKDTRKKRERLSTSSEEISKTKTLRENAVAEKKSKLQPTKAAKGESKEEAATKLPERKRSNVVQAAKESAIIQKPAILNRASRNSIHKSAAVESPKKSVAKPAEVAKKSVVKPASESQKKPVDKPAPATTKLKPNKRKKTELDKLHHDINEYHDRDGIVHLGGPRSCTLSKPKKDDDVMDEALLAELWKKYNIKESMILLERVDLNSSRMGLRVNRRSRSTSTESVSRNSPPKVAHAHKSLPTMKHSTELATSPKKLRMANEDNAAAPNSVKKTLFVQIEKLSLPKPKVSSNSARNRKRASWSHGIIRKSKKQDETTSKMKLSNEWEDINEEEKISKNFKVLKLSQLVNAMDSCCKEREKSGQELSLQKTKKRLKRTLTPRKLRVAPQSSASNASLLQEALSSTSMTPSPSPAQTATHQSAALGSAVKFFAKASSNFSYTLSPSGNRLICEICRFESIERNAFVNHIKEAHLNSLWSRYCYMCKKFVTSTGSNLECEFNHMMTHLMKDDLGEKFNKHAAGGSTSKAPKIGIIQASKPFVKLAPPALGPLLASLPASTKVRHVQGTIVPKPPIIHPIKRPLPTLAALSSAPSTSPSISPSPLPHKENPIKTWPFPGIRKLVQVGTVIPTTLIQKTPITPSTSIPQSIPAQATPRLTIKPIQSLMSGGARENLMLPPDQSAVQVFVGQLQLNNNSPGTFEPSSSPSLIELLKTKQDKAKEAGKLLKILNPRPWISDVTNKTQRSCSEMLENKKCLAALYKCMGSTCSYYTSDSAVFTDHLNVHAKLLSQINKDFLMCAYCDHVAFDPPALVRHVSYKHGYDRFQCTFCFYRAYNDFHVFIQHHEAHHKERAKALIECEATMVRDLKIEYDVIKKLMPSFVPLLKCVFCTEAFYDFTSFENHLNIHPEKITLEVSKCSKCLAPVNKSTLTHHLRECHGYRQHQCVYCRFGTEQFQEIDNHLAKNHSSRFPIFCTRTLPKVTNQTEKVNLASIESLTISEVHKTLTNCGRLTIKNGLKNASNVNKIGDVVVVVDAVLPVDSICNLEKMPSVHEEQFAIINDEELPSSKTPPNMGLQIESVRSLFDASPIASPAPFFENDFDTFDAFGAFDDELSDFA